ncbi:CapA family protein [Clostridium perfringens]|uniref:CapA family protein n=1 Tax=Clostridium perfringens TaxID=1502 RepID=UPI001F054EB6|nr:CapA family protein [Clostridium perfringens]
MKIIIGADLVPTDSNVELFNNGKSYLLIGKELRKILERSDFNCFNLEVPLTDRKTPINKCGPALIAPTSSIEGFKSMKVDFLTLANNHIMDQDVQGLASTINLLKSNKILYAGAGANIKEASKPFFMKFENIKIGIYCCAEHEFSIAEKDKAGANPFDPLESLDHISQLKEESDIVIVLYHGGKEHYRYPSPALQKTCRKMVDKGADLVVCQHSHCIGCEENWKNGKIVYGQGNFLFDKSTSEYWETSLLIELSINTKSLEKNIEYIPIVKIDNTVRLADDIRKKEIITAFNKRSNEIIKEGIVEKKYYDFAEEMQWEYFSAFSGKITKNIIYRIINRISKYKFAKKYLNMRYRKSERIVLQNYIECEAHRELILAGLKGGKNVKR